MVLLDTANIPGLYYLYIISVYPGVLVPAQPFKSPVTNYITVPDSGATASSGENTGIWSPRKYQSGEYRVPCRHLLYHCFDTRILEEYERLEMLSRWLLYWFTCSTSFFSAMQLHQTVAVDVAVRCVIYHTVRYRPSFLSLSPLLLFSLFFPLSLSFSLSFFSVWNLFYNPTYLACESRSVSI